MASDCQFGDWVWCLAGNTRPCEGAVENDLHERLAMYRSLEVETVARFGHERFDTYIRNYEFFVIQIDLGALGGGRFVGWKRASTS